MTKTSWLVTTGILVALHGSAGGAAAGETLPQGERVRVRTTVSEAARTGTVEAWTSDELVLRTSPSSDPVRVRRNEISSLERSLGKRRHVVLGLLAGAATWGAVVGLTAAFDTLDESGVGEPLFIGSLLAVGAGVGAAVKTERWEPVSSARVSLELAPAQRGVQARVAVRF
jgi:hypothetical protein